MRNDVLLEFYNKNFNGVIPFKPDGRIRDYLTDMLPYYLRNLAIQEMVAKGHKIEGGKGHFSQKTEEELSHIVSCLREEILMSDKNRCISRIKRTLLFSDDSLDFNQADIDNMIEEEMATPDFQRLCYELDFYSTQLQDYINICDKHGAVREVTTPSDNIVLRNRI